MTGADFLEALIALGLTREGFAERFSLDRSTVYRWTQGTRAVPAWVPAVLDLLNREYVR